MVHSQNVSDSLHSVIQKDFFKRYFWVSFWPFHKDWIVFINVILQPWDKIFLCKLEFDVKSLGFEKSTKFSDLAAHLQFPMRVAVTGGLCSWTSCRSCSVWGALSDEQRTKSCGNCATVTSNSHLLLESDMKYSQMVLSWWQTGAPSVSVELLLGGWVGVCVVPASACLSWDGCRDVYREQGWNPDSAFQS